MFNYLVLADIIDGTMLHLIHLKAMRVMLNGQWGDPSWAFSHKTIPIGYRLVVRCVMTVSCHESLKMVKARSGSTTTNE